jgi:uncharacterized UPF0160 family protein
MAIDKKFGKVATHNGIFHSDDVFAVATLKIMDPYLEIVRTRNPDIIKSADTRVDVGREYNHEERSYDHHQKGGAGKRENGREYSSFGLIWKHYGSEICGSDEIAEEIDKGLVQKIDGVDTGVIGLETDENTPAYLGPAIFSLNPSWQEENPNPDQAFDKAVNFAYDVLQGMIKRGKGKKLAEKISREAIERSKNRGQITLDRYVPWHETIINESSEIKYVVHPSQDGSWMVAAVPNKFGARNYRKPFPKDWAGLNDFEFQKLTGVEDATFCHNDRFIAGAKSLEGAENLAKLALENEEGKP